jgi:hypothetical protein
MKMRMRAESMTNRLLLMTQTPDDDSEESSMHWLSDTVAGMLMGYAIGSAVGQDFCERWENKKEKSAGSALSVSPGLFSVSFSIAL